MIEKNASAPAEIPMLADEAERITGMHMAAQRDAESCADDILIEGDIEEAAAEPTEDVTRVEALDSGVEDDSLLATPNPIFRYLQDVRTVPLLSRDEEIGLARKIEEGERQIVDEALSSVVALRRVLNLGKTVAAGQVSMRDVVKLKIATSGEYFTDEKVLRARFRRRMRKLHSLAKNCRPVTRQWKSVPGPARRDPLDAKIMRLIKSLDLNQQQIDAIIQEHRNIYERAKALEESSSAQSKRRKEIHAVEKSIGMPIAELRRKIFTIQDQKAQVAAAKHDFVQANLRLVAAIVKKYCGHGLAYLDLVQEGNIGLMRAVDKFDYRLGFRFATYASWWIRQAVTRSLQDCAHTIRIPVHMVELNKKLTHTMDSLSRQFDRQPTTAEIAGRMAITELKVQTILNLVKEPFSLETPLGDDADNCVGDMIPDEHAADPEAVLMEVRFRQEMQKLLRTLTPREEKIICMRFGIREKSNYTLEETGKVFGITRERIRQIEAIALKKLRRSTPALRDFMPTTR